MGAIKETAVAVKKTGRATQRTARGTTDWPMALFFGPLLDIRLRRFASETGLNPTHAAIRRRLEASTWARWLSVIAYIAVIALVILFFGWLLAPLIPVAWVILTRRRAWWKGQPTLRQMLSPGAWVAAGLSLIPPTAALFELLFEPLPEDVRGWVMNGSGWLAATVAFLSALAVSERLNNPRQEPFDKDVAGLMSSLVDMSEAAYNQHAGTAFKAARQGEQLYAVFPRGFESKLTRAAIEEKLRERNSKLEIASLDLDERRLVLEPAAATTARKREALVVSNGLVDDLLDEHEDGGQPSVGLDWGRFN